MAYSASGQAKRTIGWSLVASSLLLHLFTVVCFARQPDHFAAFTVLPIWFWGLVGMGLSGMAFLFLSAPLSLITSVLWCVTLLLASDESKALGNIGKDVPLPGKPAAWHGKPVIRSLTLNCSRFSRGSPADDIARWSPDIILLQEVSADQVRLVADVAFGGRGDYRAHGSNGIVTRWKIQREIRNPTINNQQTTVSLPNGESLEIVNIHLVSAATDLRFWSRDSWRNHRVNRSKRLDELNLVKQVLEATTSFPNSHVILGGDFNAPASDIVHTLLAPAFTNSFSAVGTGWGNTFQRRFPILRIDHIYSTPSIRPVRSHVAVTRHSDHRMVVSDFVFN